jgi:hypothetical protein
LAVAAKKRLHSNDDSFDVSWAEAEDEVSSKESMNQPDSLEEKLRCKRAYDGVRA